MLGWRFVAGVLGGLSLGVAFSVLARLNNPDRAFGTLLFVQFSVGSLVVYLLPSLEALINAYAVFYVMASIALLSVVFITFLPRLDLSKDVKQRPRSAFGEYRNACLLLAAITLYQIAASAIWAYVGLIGPRGWHRCRACEFIYRHNRFTWPVGCHVARRDGQSFGALELGCHGSGTVDHGCTATRLRSTRDAVYQCNGIAVFCMASRSGLLASGYCGGRWQWPTYQHGGSGFLCRFGDRTIARIQPVR